MSLQAGVPLVALYLATGNLWLAVGTHVARDFREGSLGIPDSGQHTNGFWTTELSGPTWITGSAFGYEQSVVTVCCWPAVGDRLPGCRGAAVPDSALQAGDGCAFRQRRGDVPVQRRKARVKLADSE